LIAKSVLTCGLPLFHDKKNSFTVEEGRDMSPGGLPRLFAWLPFYAVALSFASLGINELTARLPFALAGLASVPLCYLFARRLWQSRLAAALAALLLATSVPYLVLSRQCRYYSFGALFTLLGLIFYDFIVQRKRWGGGVFRGCGESAVSFSFSLFAGASGDRAGSRSHLSSRPARGRGPVVVLRSGIESSLDDLARARLEHGIASGRRVQPR